MSRTIVLVAGSGRSGTSTVAGILQRLGFLVPPPEVPADGTNPRGFAESQWVVDFHTDLLCRANVQVADARPAAWADAARLCLDADVRRTLRTWLEAQFDEADDLVVKDPRLTWFLALWRRCAHDAGADVACITMLRHPAAVIDSKQRWYGGAAGTSARAAGWINQTLFTERATRDEPRVFVRYDELLEDWPRVVARVGRMLDLARVRDAPAAALRDVQHFVDHRLSRSTSDWGGVSLAPALRAQAEEVWQLVARLAEDGAYDGPTVAALETARAAYVAAYAEAEALAHSSIVAAGRARAPAAPRRRMRAPARWLVRAVPRPIRRRVPPRWRSRLANILVTTPQHPRAARG